MIVASLLQWLPFFYRHRRFIQDPAGTQARLLRRLLQRAAHTEWGRRYGFAELARARDVVRAYQTRVPLHTYEDFRADVERMRRGVPDICWPGRIRHFAVSSGTASEGTLIPVSREMLRADRRFSIEVGLHYLLQSGRWSFLKGRHLTLPGRADEDPRYPGTWAGEISGLVARHAPWYVRLFYQAVPDRILMLPNWEAKLRAIAQHTLHQDIRLVVMAPTWGLVLFNLLLEEARRQGHLATTVRDIWPNLQVFISGGVALSSYRTLLEEMIGQPAPDFIETYGASEGFFAFQSTRDDPAMLLHLDNGIFYEFVPLEARDHPNPPRYTIATIEPGVRYALYVTTCSGLWSYAMRDVVRFTQTNPPKLVVAGRTSEMLDLYGEAVFGDEARAALEEACRRTGARVHDYHIAPRPATRTRPPTHQWLIEFAHPPADLSAFAMVIDAHLQRVNRHYQIRREARAFDRPEIVALPPGAFLEWMRRHRARLSGQSKIPRMRSDRRLADALLAQCADFVSSTETSPDSSA
ncbi:GH3 auxin-responsive promoter family protein [Rhodothermus profundi]|uniref:Phenylacetate-coenzyme A ligase PaaK, adenylate-forming domain family n=1 Tax=Rhodothermus profundi TaxID=633813 RepID=A0A1M6TYG9_9BACT|nr:GH3 auxin-responsive promoter family protein [Rhodothermus profundi]SHK62017.1 Phenylacetate-coenzyme A ligase PaaK, adenylate-forming domain family [Rhodothermus profundi]